MTFGFDPHFVTNLGRDVSASAYAEQKLTAQLSSGLRVGTLSDDPMAAAQNVGLASSISQTDAFVQTATRESSLLQVTDTTLGDVLTQVNSALSLAAQAANGTLSASHRFMLGEQVAGVRDTLVSLANTSYLGQYLFSGSNGMTKPFSLDHTTSPSTVIYAGDALTQSVTTLSGEKIQANVPGQDVFSRPGADLLGALNQIISDLSGVTQGSLPDDTAALTAAVANVAEQRARLGSSAKQLDAASSAANSNGLQARVSQSTLLAADPAVVATDLKSAEVQHQALLSVIAGLSRTNLFDYLK